MSLGTALQIAMRQMIRRRRATLLSLLGIVVASALFSVVMAVTSGQHAYLRARLIGVTPHVTVTAERLEPLVPRRLFDVDGGVVELVVNTPPTDRHEIKPRVEVATRARRSSGLVREVAPFVLLQGVFRNGPRYRTVEIRGVDPNHERGVDRRRGAGRRGALAVLKANPEGTIIGEELARRIAVRPGSDVTLITSAGVIRRLRVIEVFRSDVDDVDASRVYVNLPLAQSLRGMARNAATGLALHLSEPARAERVATSVERATGYRTETWEETRSAVLTAYRAREIVAWIVAVLALVVAGFGLANALTASVLASLERPAAHASRDSVTASVVVAEGLLLGLTGGALGAALGLGIAYWLSRSRVDAIGLVEAFVRFDRPPVSLDPGVFLTAIALAAIVALAATIAPARHAAAPSPTVDVPVIDVPEVEPA